MNTAILPSYRFDNDEDGRFWIEQWEKRTEFTRMKAPTKFKAIKVAAAREDWPAKCEWTCLSEADCRLPTADCGSPGS